MFDFLDELLEQLLEVAETGDEEATKKVFTEIIEQVKSKYSPLIKLAPHIVEMAQEEILPGITFILKSATAACKEKKFKKALSEFFAARAMLRKEKLESLITNGFTREEAIQIMLAEISSMNIPRNITVHKKS